MAMESAADVTLNSLTFDGKGLHVDIADALTAATLKRTMDGAPTLTLTLFDPLQRLVTSGIFALESKTAQVDGKSFSLVQITKSGSNLNLTFEDLAVAEMRKHVLPLKVDAGSMTRLDFARKLLAEDGTGWINIYPSPGATMETTKVELARGTVASASADTGATDPAYSGTTATGGALTVLEVAKAAKAAGFSGNDLVTAVAVAGGESTWIPGNINSPNGPTGPQYYGLMQIADVHGALLAKYNNNWRDPVSNFKMALEIFKATGWSQSWESYSSGSYKKFLAQAQAAVNNITSLKDASGTTVGNLTASQRNKSTREALLGGAEDTWTCIKRIFSEINWRAYIDWDPNNVASVYVGPDSGFIIATSEINVTQDSQGVDDIDYDFDIGKSSATATLTCRAHRWQLPPGTMVNLPTTGLPNPWLVRSVDRSFFSLTTTVSLTKPEPALPEPDVQTDDLGVDGAYAGIPETDVDVGGGSGDWHWPVPGTHTITTKFGAKSAGTGEPHQGIDIAVPVGTPIYASQEGTVIMADNKFNPGGYGNLIQIQHYEGYQTWYAHVSSFKTPNGLKVNQGDLIGLTGGAKGAAGSGDSTGPHLHFEIRNQGTPIDPLPLLKGKDGPTITGKPGQTTDVLGKPDANGQYSIQKGTQPKTIAIIPNIP